MSLSPRWAHAILSGQKSIELRRNRSGCEANSPVIIYSSFPEKKVIGRAKVKEVLSGPLEEIWEKTKDENGCGKSEFRDYFKGAKEAYAISLAEVTQLDPKDLPFNGPQSFRYLFADDPQQKDILESAGLISAPVKAPANAD
jgi:predicted transcriptional regulator